MFHTIRDFFYENGFMEINTPKLVASATEGGTELFPITYFEKEAFLGQSPQLYKQMMMSKVEWIKYLKSVKFSELKNMIL